MRSAFAIACLGIERGFEGPGFAVLSEQDVLGDRMVRAQSRARRAQNFIQEASALTPGDLVTHIVEHGIGRYVGLKAIDALGAPHDCLELQYDGGKLFLPVENIELLTRYGSDEGAQPSTGWAGAGWQSLRKAKMKERVRAIAAELIKIAAARQLKSLPPVEPPSGLYDEFAARFPYQETEDQDKAIGEVIGDLAAGRPMDRLVCGDVGFGKTEVAMRAAFVAAMGGEQVAVVVPTTLLARQHYRGFAERFAGFPLKVRQLSRFVDPKDAKETKEALADGTVDIVIGTHALLAESISFKRLGLVIVDEEQHFGVVHKERLKNLKADVHVLTLDGDVRSFPAHCNWRAVGRARAVADHDAADRPSGGAHFRYALRSAGGARGAAARALSRRTKFLRRAPHCRPARSRSLPQERGARGQGGRRPWPDVSHSARRGDDCLL